MNRDYHIGPPGAEVSILARLGSRELRGALEQGAETGQKEESCRNRPVYHHSRSAPPARGGGGPAAGPRPPRGGDDPPHTGGIGIAIGSFIGNSHINGFITTLRRSQIRRKATYWSGPRDEPSIHRFWSHSTHFMYTQGENGSPRHAAVPRRDDHSPPRVTAIRRDTRGTDVRGTDPQA